MKKYYIGVGLLCVFGAMVIGTYFLAVHKKSADSSGTAASYGGFTSSPANASDSQRKSDLRNIKTGMETYYNDNNSYPSAATWKTDLVSGATPYMRSIPKDPRTNADYSYTPDPAGCKTTCTSYVLTAKLDNKKDPDAGVAGVYTVTSAN